MSWPKGVSRKTYNDLHTTDPDSDYPLGVVGDETVPQHKLDELHQLTERPYPENPEVLATLTWVGNQIKLRNMSGKRSDRFCLFCRHTNLRGQTCLHNKIWDLTGTHP